jgi:tRNA modification GTPase
MGKVNKPSVDTIAALATASGRGGIAIVRVSGPLVSDISRAVLGTTLNPRQATHLSFRDANGDSIDDGVAIFFPNPNSFTGEDVLELQGHGGPVVVDLILQRILELGARLARPGEFSERAFLNGKLDLAQAEAIADLINASSKQAARSAMRSLQGEFSNEIHALNEKIIQLRMYVEAAIDFTDEEIDFLSDANVVNQLENISAHLSTIQRKAQQGSFLREGITAVIVGEPNVGKSSLLNHLSGKEVAIVTDIPGTTRDVLRDYVLIDGMPMHIIDTAGLRDSDDVVELEGIRRAYHEMEKADLVLYVTDASKPAPDDHHQLPAAVAANCPIIFIQNKIDLVNQSPTKSEKDGATIISLSVKLGAGIDLLKHQIKSQVGFQGALDGIFLARRRHLDALKRAESHVSDAIKQLTETRAGELAAEELRLSHRALSEITGDFTTDDLLGRIFSSFCIGK